MADLVINGKNFNGVSSVKIPNSGGTQETFIQPSGDKNISANGTVDVSAFARAIVNVPQSASGTKEINANGTYDIAAFAQAVVNVPTSGGITNISTGSVYPTDVTQVSFPVDSSKDTPIAIFGWSDAAYEAGRTCGCIGMCNYTAAVSHYEYDFSCFSLFPDGDYGLTAASQTNGRPKVGTYICKRGDTSHNMSTADEWKYVVFYKPVGDLSFGGDSE